MQEKIGTIGTIDHISFLLGYFSRISVNIVFTVAKKNYRNQIISLKLNLMQKKKPQ